MPLYMDRHEGVTQTCEEIAEVHLRDIEIQGKYGVRYVTYWIEEEAQQAFCLVDAPSKERAALVHKEAHDDVANEIIEVNQPVVEEFMGRIANTPAAKDPATTEWVPAVRAILFTDLESSVAETQQLGDARYVDQLRVHNTVIRDSLDAHNGREVKHTGDGIMASFVAASAAVESAITMQKSFATQNEARPEHPFRVRIGISAGEPVMDHDDLYGSAVNLAKRICDCAETGGILVAQVVRELCIGKDLPFADTGETELRGFEDPVRLYEVPWQQ